jgi:short-subunit dehydrogenase
LAGSVAVVTGAGRGIGLSVALALAGAGVTVVGVGRDEEALRRMVRATGGSYLACDLREQDSAERVVAYTLETHGRLDILVANAGVGHAGDVADMTAERVAELMETNVVSPLQLARACVPAMRAQADGKMLFVTSIAGALGVPGEAVYSASKAAVEMFADVLREEVRADGITVGTLLPGVVDTDFFERRGLPYDRRFPRPMPPDRVARAALDMLLTGDRLRVIPRWLAVPIRLRSVAPALYRRLERRFG